jgi:hypothetical protein
MISKNDIKWININDITPYDKNPRKNDKAVKDVAKSITEYGFNQPIVIDKNNIIVVGHTRWKASKLLNLTEVPVLYMPEGIDESKVKAYRIADNKLNELALWDDTLLAQELEELIKELDDVTITGFKQDEIDKLFAKEDEQYTKKIDTPLYTPKGIKPQLSDLYNKSHTEKLLSDITAANIPEDIKYFLTLAAYRHTQFNYDVIAEYYCHAEPEIQTLMENSALVIIDFDRAIELGYAKLRDDIADVFLEGKTDDET